MYVRDKQSGDLVEVVDIQSLVDPLRGEFTGRYHHGEELQDPAPFNKREMVFPSGEALPQCWLDPEYRSK